MLNLFRKFLRPTLREQLEDGVRVALRRYVERQIAPTLRIYISTDLVPDGLDPALWARDEAEHQRRFALQWAEDNSVPRAGLRIEMVLLDTKQEFAFVKPLGLDAEPEAVAHSTSAAPESRSAPQHFAPTPSESALLGVVSSPARSEPLRIMGELIVGRRAEGDAVLGIGDRYMSSRHARFHLSGGRLYVTDLDSKNRTFVNERPLTPHQQMALALGDRIRMGTTTFQVERVGV